MPTRRSVFVVDDDASVRMSIKRLLREHGFTTLLFESAAALLDHAEFESAICIIIDIDLADQSGIDLRRRIADNGVSAPVIYITGNDCERNRSAAVASGCVAYLTKPFAAQSLVDLIERARENRI